MKSVILDENIPRRLGSRLFGHRVTTVAEQGWGGVKNGRLMALIDGSYDVFVTADKNLRYQQNLAGRKFPSSESLSTIRHNSYRWRPKFFLR